MQPTGITYEEGTNWGCGSTKECQRFLADYQKLGEQH